VTKYLTVRQVKLLHLIGILEYGGSPGLLFPIQLESALAQPQATFDGVDLIPTVPEKAAALGFFLAKNHAFEDGNKRVGFAAMKTFLKLNEYDFNCTAEDGERTILAMCDGKMNRAEFNAWVIQRCEPKVTPEE